MKEQVCARGTTWGRSYTVERFHVLHGRVATWRSRYTEEQVHEKAATCLRNYLEGGRHGGGKTWSI